VNAYKNVEKHLYQIYQELQFWCQESNASLLKNFNCLSKKLRREIVRGSGYEYICAKSVQ